MGREFRGLRVHFRVEMAKGALTKAAIDLYNPAPDSIALAQTKGIAVELLAGYDVPIRIFVGNPIRDGVKFQVEKPDNILHIEAQDGARAWTTSRVNVAFATQTSLSQALSTVAASMGIVLGMIDVGSASSIFLTQGLVLHGQSSDVLDRICQSAGLEWFIRDNALHVIPANGTTGETVPVFSSTAGNLIGSPQQTKDGIEVTALLSPTLRIGKMFQVQSAKVNGMFTCYAALFQGDSGFDRDFYVTARGRPI